MSGKVTTKMAIINQLAKAHSPKLYIAGMGSITPVGCNIAMTSSVIAAGISAYSISKYHNRHFQPITISTVPDVIFNDVEATIIQSEGFNAQHERVIKMAIIALREACVAHKGEQAIPLILAMPEVSSAVGCCTVSGLIKNLAKNCQPWVSAPLSRSVHSGRAAGMEALTFAFDYLYDLPNEFMLVGGSDSYLEYSRLNLLDEADRLLYQSSLDGFALGEAAGFLLLTRHPKLALVRDGHIIAVNLPGIADELGHLASDAPYRGDGLDQAFKKAINNYNGGNIHSIYSSMNGENYWSKEYGVAYIRNKAAFQNPVRLEHPADCYGDLGSATCPILIALAAEHLFKNSKANAHLVYGSSDSAKRGAVVVEKIAIADLN